MMAIHGIDGMRQKMQSQIVYDYTPLKLQLITTAATLIRYADMIRRYLMVRCYTQEFFLFLGQKLVEAYMFRSFKFFIFLLRPNFLSGWLDGRSHDGTNHSAFAHVAFLSLTDYLGAVLLSMIFSLSCLRACNLFFLAFWYFLNFYLHLRYIL